jgi:hypothetical protein
MIGSRDTKIRQLLKKSGKYILYVLVVPLNAHIQMSDGSDEELFHSCLFKNHIILMLYIVVFNNNAYVTPYMLTDIAYYPTRY